MMMKIREEEEEEGGRGEETDEERWTRRWAEEREEGYDYDNELYPKKGQNQVCLVSFLISDTVVSPKECLSLIHI